MISLLHKSMYFLFNVSPTNGDLEAKSPVATLLLLLLEYKKKFTLSTTFVFVIVIVNTILSCLNRVLDIVKRIDLECLLGATNRIYLWGTFQPPKFNGYDFLKNFNQLAGIGSYCIL